MEAGAVIVRRLSLEAAFFTVYKKSRVFMKNIICKKCNLKNYCIDLPGFCLWLPYTAIVFVIIMLIYFARTTQL